MSSSNSTSSSADPTTTTTTTPEQQQQITKQLNYHLKQLFLEFDENPHFVLPKDSFKKLKLLFKKDHSLVTKAYDSCIIYLARRDSRVRFRCLLFLRQLMSRSSKTRTLIERDFNEILEKCIIGEGNGGDSQLVNSGTERTTPRKKNTSSRGKRKATTVSTTGGGTLNISAGSEGSVVTNGGDKSAAASKIRKKIKMPSKPHWQRNRRSVGTSKFIQVRVLPEPENVAVELRELALRTVEEWNDVYGSLYPKITVGYNYLKNVLLLKFPDVRGENVRMAKQKREQQEYAQKLLRAKYARVKREFSENVNDMIITLKEAEEILRMLVPDFETLLQRTLHDPDYKREDIMDFLRNNGGTGTSLLEQNDTNVEDYSNETATSVAPDIRRDDEEEEEEDEWEEVELPASNNANDDDDDDNILDMNDFQDLLHSANSEDASTGRNVTISLKKSIAELKTKENKDIIEALEEKMKEIVKTYKPMVEDWYTVISKLEVSDKEKREYERLYKNIIDLKSKIGVQMRKCSDLDMNLEFNGSTSSGFYSVPQLSVEELAKNKVNQRKRSRDEIARSKAAGVIRTPKQPTKKRKTKFISIPRSRRQA